MSTQQVIALSNEFAGKFRVAPTTLESELLKVFRSGVKLAELRSCCLFAPTMDSLQWNLGRAEDPIRNSISARLSHAATPYVRVFHGVSATPKPKAVEIAPAGVEGRNLTGTLPPKAPGAGRPATAPYAMMQIGDWFIDPRSNASHAAHTSGKRHDHKYRTRRLAKGGTLVTRVA